MFKAIIVIVMYTKGLDFIDKRLLVLFLQEMS